MTVAFWLLTRRTHATLVGAIRDQRSHYLLSRRDSLTNLPNRASMRDTLARHLSEIGTEDGPSQVAVLCLDLDGFKAINDRFGHAAGDEVLVHVAGLLRRHIGAGDTACRIGGDEYVLLLPDADEARVRSLGRSIIEATAQPVGTRRAAQARIGVSIGAAIARESGRRPKALVEEADAALHAAERPRAARDERGAGRRAPRARRVGMRSIAGRRSTAAEGSPSASVLPGMPGRRAGAPEGNPPCDDDAHRPAPTIARSAIVRAVAWSDLTNSLRT
ncbi:GGDEF domain-containing protein [Methylobacterium platani]|uniref:GGDEF domain-containing protein n=1 Tax=Methylobacterium platani TaxID=427683 RepID=A0A179S6B0_9HYPH|nr:GGDEF domain-containing protein [Methylobacterium platani]OAS20056.1 hypothetical protein A5481_23395 [Methylobacterium platani]